MNKQPFKLETDLNTLRSLVAVVEEGGFSAAARRVHRTQSAVSVQIAKLEDQLSTKLLERTSRSVSLTPEGEVVISYARRILQLADEAAMTVCPQEETDQLRVGFAEYLAPQHLQAVVSGFREKNPDCDLNLVLGLGGPLLDMMQRGELDLVIAGPEGDNGNLLWKEPLAWTGVYEGTADDPQPIKLVLLPPPCMYRKLAFDSLTKIAHPWRMSIEANSFEAVQSSIRAGLGATILPVTAIKEDMPILEGCLPELPNTTVMSYDRARGPHPYSQRFIDYLLDSIQKS